MDRFGHHGKDTIFPSRILCVLIQSFTPFFQIAESIISLLPIAISSLNVALSHRAQRRQTKLFASTERGTDYVDLDADDDEEEELEPPERLVPMSWVWIGLISSSVGGVAIVWALFGVEAIKPWATALGFLLACLLSLLGWVC